MKTRIDFFLTLLFSVTFFSLQAQTIRYVDAKGSNSNDGLTWATAYEGLQKAIDMSSPGDQIWVKSGIHCPGQVPAGGDKSDNRQKTYVLKSDVSIYGGFLGNETSIGQRDLTNNVTIFSGDLGSYGDPVDNAYHVFIANGLSKATILDGFVITSGNANSNTSFMLDNQEVFNNYGGGMFNTNNSSPTMSNITFTKNNAEYGGALLNYDNSNPNISNSIFLENTADRDGAAINNMLVSCPNIRNTFFISNVAKGDGGAIANNVGANVVLDNVVFYNNCAVNGGAIFNNGANPVLQNVDFYKNIADVTGGAIYNTNNANPSVLNTILWENMINKNTQIKGSDIDNDATSSTDIKCSVTQLNSIYSQGVEILNNIDPQFIYESLPIGPDGIWGTSDDGLRLSCNSPVVNIGKVINRESDAIGSIRLQGVKTDLGAYESTRTNETLATSRAQLSIPIEPGTYNSERVIKEDGFTHYCTCDNQIIVSLESEKTDALVTENAASINITPDLATFYSQNVGFITNPKGAAIINRTWVVNPMSQPTTDVSVIYYFTDNEYTYLNQLLQEHKSEPLKAISQMRMFNINDMFNHTKVEGIAPNTVNQLISKSGDVSTTNWLLENVNDFVCAQFKTANLFGGGAGAASAGTGILPVEMIYFNADKEESSVVVSWATSSEVNNKGFQVQHSYDGVNFYKIGWVDGNGTTVVKKEYNFEHLEPNHGINYYRLIQEDVDGKTNMSHVTQIRFDKKPTIEIYPNPAMNASYVNLEIISKVDEVAKVKVFSMLDGKHEFTRNQELIKGKNKVVFDIKNLKSGVYSVILESKNGVQTGVIIK